MFRFPDFIGTLLLVFLGWIANPFSAVSQTCSCAGAPLLDSQDLGSIDANRLILSVTYQYHDVSDLINGSEVIDNNIFERRTQAGLLEANYGITNRLMLTGLLSTVSKRNETRSSTFESSGVGDAVLMAKYTLHQNRFDAQYQVSAGAGVKMPLGQSDEVGPNNLELQPDMQPGTESWDGLFWLYASKTFLPATTLNIFATSSYRLTGESQPFAQSDRTYQFGDEWTSKLGASIQVFERFKPNLRIKYRLRTRDTVEGSNIPNTGGQWLNVIPGVNVSLLPSLSMRVAAELPLYRNLNGTLQSSTNYALSTALFYSFNL